MENQLSREALIKKILDADSINDDYDAAIDMLLEKTVSQDVTKKRERTFGNRVSDKLAQVAGSWAFILSFIGVLVIWIVINIVLLTRPFDPYPFILLNLVLSCLAAIQAPIIMMSQNRQESKDRMRAENDYKVNLKAELILEDMHEKLDTLIENQETLLKRIEDIEETQEKSEMQN